MATRDSDGSDFLPSHHAKFSVLSSVDYFVIYDDCVLKSQVNVGSHMPQSQTNRLSDNMSN